MDYKKKLRKIYGLLEDKFGDLGWWPAEGPFEVIVGAILTQNTSWSNVEKAISKMKRENLLSPRGILKARTSRLAGAIRPAGYFMVKAGRLKEVSRFVMAECGGRLGRLKKSSTSALRNKLLAVKGVGPETADSILVYALGKPVFVVDAYTRRVFSRHGIIPEKAAYSEIQALVHGNFPRDQRKLNQFHALLVETGKRYCRKKGPLCEECPLKNVKRKG